MALCDNLKKARLRMGQTQLIVSKNIGISNTALSNYETGYRQPDLDTLKQLARYYDVSIDTLAELSDIGEDTVFDLWTLIKSKRIAYRGTIYELKESRRAVLRKLLDDGFESFK